MANYTKKSGAKQTKRPSTEFPELFAWLAYISMLAKELHESLTDEQVGDKLGVTKQTILHHRKKQMKGNHE